MIVEETRLGISDLRTNTESTLMAKQQTKDKHFGNKSADQSKLSKRKADSVKMYKKRWICGGPYLRYDCPKKKQNKNYLDCGELEFELYVTYSPLISSGHKQVKWGWERKEWDIRRKRQGSSLKTNM